MANSLLNKKQLLPTLSKKSTFKFLKQILCVPSLFSHSAVQSTTAHADDQSEQLMYIWRHRSHFPSFLFQLQYDGNDDPIKSYMDVTTDVFSAYKSLPCRQLFIYDLGQWVDVTHLFSLYTL